MTQVIKQYINARLVIAPSRKQLGNRLARTFWDSKDSSASICLPEAISVNEQLSAILEMMARGKTYSYPDLTMHGRELLQGGSILFLLHLVLHEIAHVRLGLPQNRDVACDLWAMQQLPKIKKGFGMNQNP